MKNPTDLSWANNPGMNKWREFMRKYMPDTDLTNASIPCAYGASITLLQVLR